MIDVLERYCTASELARSLGVSRSVIYVWVRRGLIPQGLKIGHVRRWRVSEVRKALEEMNKGGIAE